MKKLRSIFHPDKIQCTKTVELIESFYPWQPNSTKIPYNKIMHLHVEYGEKKISCLIKSASDSWDKEKKYWELPNREVISLGLEERIMALYGIQWVIKFQFSRNEINHVNEIINISVSSSPFLC